MKSSIYSYVGVIIGFLSTAILLPRYLTTAEIGTIRQVQYYAVVITSLMAVGLPLAIIKLFPFINNKQNHHNGFLKFILIIGLVSSIVFGVFLSFKLEWIVLSDIKKSELFGEYYRLIIPFSIFSLFFLILDQYATAVKESTIGIFLKDVVLRFALLVLISLFIFKIFDYKQLIIGITYSQIIPLIAIILFLYYKKQFLLQGQYLSTGKNRLKEFTIVAGFGWVSNLGAIIVESTDSIMLSKILGSEQVGIYTTVFYFAALMRIPNRSLNKIGSALTAEHFKSGNLAAVESIYVKSAITQLIIGVLLFCNMVLLIPFIFDYVLKPEYSEGKWVLILIGLANLVRMATGIKFAIIFNSDKYKWSTFFLIGFVTLLISTNYWLIPKYGMNGAAMASLISIVIYHFTAILFLWHFYRFNPLTFKWLTLTVISLMIFIVSFYIPSFLPDFIMSFFRAAVFTLIFSSIVVRFKFSTDINNQLNKLFNK